MFHLSCGYRPILLYMCSWTVSLHRLPINFLLSSMRMACTETSGISRNFVCIYKLLALLQCMRIIHRLIDRNEILVSLHVAIETDNLGQGYRSNKFSRALYVNINYRQENQ